MWHTVTPTSVPLQHLPNMSKPFNCLSRLNRSFIKKVTADRWGYASRQEHTKVDFKPSEVHSLHSSRVVFLHFVPYRLEPLLCLTLWRFTCYFSLFVSASHLFPMTGKKRRKGDLDSDSEPNSDVEFESPMDSDPPIGVGTGGQRGQLPLQL